MAEPADAGDSKSPEGNLMWVRFPLRALRYAALVLIAACAAPTAPSTPPSPEDGLPPFVVPAIQREFRGMWIATVANIDWPSQAVLPVQTQQQELVNLLSIAEQTRLNAVILQVRAAGDALYPSQLEPWMRSLSGQQGTDPGYDPLAFAVQEAHARGLELHAWFNPFRAGNLSDTLRLAETHFAKRRPDLLRRYCTQLWFDPGEPDVQAHALAVISDVIRRYDVDAVHLDDFFYPYPNPNCPNLDFPDSAGYARFLAEGGSLSKGDWRRSNVNRFVERLYQEVRGLSPHVKVGISPFGIWRPGNPAGVTGLDAYASIYADSRRWFAEGWVDYFAPQLYWSIASTGQSFPALLDWWREQNDQRRHLWPGLASYRVADGTSSAFSSMEIPNQITLVRQQQATRIGGASGTILYNGSSVRTDRGGFRSTLIETLYANAAIPPATTWLDATAPAAPELAVTRTSEQVQVRLAGVADVYWWFVRWRDAGRWHARLIRASQETVTFPGSRIDGIAVAAVDRLGNASPDAVWRR